MPFRPVLLFPYLPIFPIFLSLPISLDVSLPSQNVTEWFIFLLKPSLPLILFRISWQLHHSPCLSGLQLFCISDAFHLLLLSFMFSLLPGCTTFPLSPKLSHLKVIFYLWLSQASLAFLLSPITQNSDFCPKACWSTFRPLYWLYSFLHLQYRFFSFTELKE